MAREASFSSVLVMIGSVLIALGVAWLVAQNWHQLLPISKIVILFGATGLALFAGVTLRKRGYAVTGGAVVLLGSLLFTLSIFLVAQIYHFGTDPQSVAWLFLLSFLGVLAVAYLLSSWVSLVVAFVEMLIWIIIQFFAFGQAVQGQLHPGLLAVYLLLVGAGFYGLSLFHRGRDHAFADVYRWWTVFYALAFTYMLSFQLFLPVLWSQENVSSGAGIAFLVFLIALAAGAIAAGLYANPKVPRKEALGAGVIFLVLLVLVALTGVTADAIGDCREKQCWDYRSAAACADPPGALECVWKNDYCQAPGCFLFGDEASCLASGLSCSWEGGACIEQRCERLAGPDQCAASDGCVFVNGFCQTENCFVYQSESSCAGAGCSWERSRCVDADACASFGVGACTTDPSCSWSARGQAPPGSVPLPVWVVWIIINVVFVGVIVAVTGYGTLVKSPGLINLAIGFFALDVVTRYIGFMMDLWGYTSLAVVFISGGLVLLVGGYLVERWRKRLMKKAESR